MEKFCKIKSVLRAITDYENYLLSKYNLSLNDVMLICKLNDDEKITSGDLAEDLCLTCSNTSKIIKSLEEKSLLTRSLDGEDKRKIILQLTKTGQDKFKEITDASDENIPEILQKILSII